MTLTVLVPLLFSVYGLLLLTWVARAVYVAFRAERIERYRERQAVWISVRDERRCRSELRPHTGQVDVARRVAR